MQNPYRFSLSFHYERLQAPNFRVNLLVFITRYDFSYVNTLCVWKHFADEKVVAYMEIPTCGFHF